MINTITFYRTVNKIQPSRPTPRPGAIGNRDNGKVEELSAQVRSNLTINACIYTVKILNNML